ncbi:Hermansky-Pudlak syndrome 1 protein isoform X2 [Ischnura elegans]|uniref:Hermansky-Pudlak syndrome 1 protein isoform X2 n=1 Tax=Ischnura elegans TaxID=197161 RepID=UPI001ED86B69|nr:Hermansky-Pudlak syndrome 1 protein isoform X2 [Ischnura elegans]
MRCILVFDHLNDILYSKYDNKFSKHVKLLAYRQGLISGELDGGCIRGKLSSNIIIQLFSPIVTSQRLMGCQFGNSYISVQCQDGTNMVFDEYMGYLFIHIGTEDVVLMKRTLSICVVFVQHLCGPDVSLLKHDREVSQMLGKLLDGWRHLRDTDQAFLVEAVEQLGVNGEIAGSSLNVLRGAADRLKTTAPDSSRVHFLLFVNSKFLSLYSRSAKDLASSDVLFLSLLTNIMSQPQNKNSLSDDECSEVDVSADDIENHNRNSYEYPKDENPQPTHQKDGHNNHEVTHTVMAEDSSEGEFYSPPDSPSNVRRKGKKTLSGGSDGELGTDKEAESEEIFDEPVLAGEPNSRHYYDLSRLRREHGISGQVHSHLMLLRGGGPGFTPHVVHIATVCEDVHLLIMIETGSGAVANGLHEAFSALTSLQSLQLQRDVAGVRAAFESLETGIKHIFDGVRKSKPKTKCATLSTFDLDACVLRLRSCWEFIRKKYLEYLRTREPDCILRIESSTPAFSDALREVFKAGCLEIGLLSRDKEALLSAIESVKEGMAPFGDFLKVKALRNFTLGSRASLTINKYLEEFPGLVHFIYVDRSTHRVTTPSLDFSSQETISLTKKKIWAMVDFSREHLTEGHVAIMWKDNTFNYAYFLWFEDSNGSPLKVKVFPSSLLKQFPIPGVLCGDFYLKLIEECFPKMPPAKVQCYELFCIHLGLATASCVLEQSRRLAATVWEVTGASNNPIDVL